jgi:REP element-mobilizing transposase RayT
MSEYHQPLIPNQTYHLFSRAVGAEKLFLTTNNYLFFLKKLKQHTETICRLYCYSLLPNHFHLLAKINDEACVIRQFEAAKKVRYNHLKHNHYDFIMERFSNCLNSYTKAFNKMQERKGALFMDYLKRSKVNVESDLTSFIWYIHKNAVHHQFTKFVGKWPFDSYHSILSEAPTSLLRKEVIEWFGSTREFIKFHAQEIYTKVDFKDV